MLPVTAALFGLVAGWAVNRLLRERLADRGDFSGGAAAVRPPSWLPTLNLVLLPAAALAISLHPAQGSAFALSQALLFFLLAYPLALVDLFTLTVEPALVLCGLALRLAALTAFDAGRLPEMLGGLLGGAGLLYLIGFAYRELRGREGLGSGDPAVMALIGAFVGWQGLPAVLLLSTAAGLLAGFPALLLARRPLSDPLPFVPFLCLGGLAVYLLHGAGIVLFPLPLPF